MTRVLLVLLAALAASGCTSSELRGLRNDLDRSTPGLAIGEGRSYSFGFVTLGAARTALAIAGGGEETAIARAALSGARRVQFAHYEVSGSLDPDAVAFPPGLGRYLDDGWMPVVRVRDTDQLVWVLTHDRRDLVDEFLLVTLTSEELVLAKVRGDLRAVIRAGLAEMRRSAEAEPKVRETAIIGEDSSAAALPPTDG